jgi:hypothetical protein
MQCNVLDEQAKIDVLYGSADPAVARRVGLHAAACAWCREEMAGLKETRERLRVWTLPESSRNEPGRRPLSWGLPLAAAVLLALGAAVVLRGSEIRHENGRFSFRMGPADDQALRRLFEEQNARHQGEIALVRASLAATLASAPVPSQAEVLGWIRESEARQNQRLLARIEEFKERSDSQRRLDMARVSAGLSYLDGKNGQHVARTSELMNYMLQASHQR